MTLLVGILVLIAVAACSSGSSHHPAQMPASAPENVFNITYNTPHSSTETSSEEPSKDESPSSNQPPHPGAEIDDSYVSRSRQDRPIILQESDPQQVDFLSAVRAGNRQQVSTLLAHKGEELREMKDNRNNTALHIAAHYGHEDIVSLLYAHNFDVNAKNDQGSTPIQVAVARSQEDVFEFLYGRGDSDLNHQNNNGDTVLHQAIQTENRKIFFRLTLNPLQLVDLDIKNNEGFTSLLLSAKVGNDDFARTLIKEGADVNAITKNGWTALHLAAHQGDENMVDLLLEANANANKRDRYNLLAYHLAEQNKHTLIGSKLFQAGELEEFRRNWSRLHENIYLKKTSLIILLIEISDSSELNARDGNDWTPLHWAVFKNLEPVVEALIENGADPIIQGKYGTTALHWGARFGLSKIMRLILQKRAPDTNVADSVGNTPLHWAADSNTPGINNIMSDLIDYRADTQTRNDYNETALDIAQLRGHFTNTLNLLY